MAKPGFKEFSQMVEKYNKRVGLRMLYRKFQVPEEKRQVYRSAWDFLSGGIKNAKMPSKTHTDNE